MSDVARRSALAMTGGRNPKLSAYGTHRLIGLAATALLTLCAVCASVAPASAAGSFGCEASAIRGTLLGGVAIEPVVANRGQAACNTVAAGLNAPLGGLLTAQVGSANTSLSGPSGRVDQQTAVASGGLTDVRVLSLPSLPITLPTEQAEQAIDAMQNLSVPLTGPLATLLGPTLSLDIRDALHALVPNGQLLPTRELLRVQGAMAYAGARCQDGAPGLQGASSVTGLWVLGQDVPAGQIVDQALTLLNGGSIDPSTIDLSLVPSIPVVSALLRPVLNGLIRNALDLLPTISIPATVAQVKVTPGGQLKSADALRQHALRVQVSILGQSLADVVVGEAIVRAAGVDCAPPAQQPPAPPVDPEEAAVADLVLGCTTRRLVLTDVQNGGGRVRLLGVADRSLAGKQVKILFPYTGKVVANPTIRPDGGFSASAPLPPKRLRSTNNARYVAVVGTERSLSLKLQRRMILSRADSANGKVTLAGRVTRPLSKPLQTITVSRRVSCKRLEVVKRVKPSADGRFKVIVDAPEGELAAVYRITTRVRKTTRNNKTYPTFTLPRAIALD
ncbi:MAG: hypothetical protein M3401_02430 [Actinomycetota bacterium]|nr:hypothetical protein [Actinomycetota bacterium]